MKKVSLIAIWISILLITGCGAKYITLAEKPADTKAEPPKTCTTQEERQKMIDEDTTMAMLGRETAQIGANLFQVFTGVPTGTALEAKTTVEGVQAIEKFTAETCNPGDGASPPTNPPPGN
jgi:hypothetical protein